MKIKFIAAAVMALSFGAQAGEVTNINLDPSTLYPNLGGYEYQGEAGSLGFQDGMLTNCSQGSFSGGPKLEIGTAVGATNYTGDEDGVRSGTEIGYDAYGNSVSSPVDAQTNSLFSTDAVSATVFAKVVIDLGGDKIKNVDCSQALELAQQKAEIALKETQLKKEKLERQEKLQRLRDEHEIMLLEREIARQKAENDFKPLEGEDKPDNSGGLPFSSGPQYDANGYPIN